MRIQPKKLLGVGFILVLSGAVIPFLILIRLLPSTYFLNFFSFGASILGLFLGVIGTSGLLAESRDKNRWMREDWINTDRD
jgi:CDP-diglyceride synthetase